MKLRIDLEKEYGIVLEGGGARGAYQIGVWKALREAGMKIKGVAGTSVGALNGALICMDDLGKAEEIWGNMTYSTVFNVDDSMIGKLKKFGVRSMKVTDAAAEFRRLFSDRGLDIAPLKKLLEETVDEERIRRSPRDFRVLFSHGPERGGLRCKGSTAGDHEEYTDGQCLFSGI